MTWRRPSQRAGYMRVHFAAAGSFDLPLTAYESLTHALDSGARTWEGVDVYGDPLWFRCEDIVSVGVASAAGLAAYDAEEAERLEYERIHGEDA